MLLVVGRQTWYKQTEDLTGWTKWSKRKNPGQALCVVAGRPYATSLETGEDAVAGHVPLGHDKPSHFDDLACGLLIKAAYYTRTKKTLRLTADCDTTSCCGMTVLWHQQYYRCSRSSQTGLSLGSDWDEETRRRGGLRGVTT